MAEQANNNTAPKSSVKKYVILGLVVILFVGGIYVLRNVIINSVLGCYSEGQRAGQIIKFSKKGTAIKTWEGEVVQRQLTNESWFFSVQDEAVVQQINEAMAKGSKVDLHYCEHQRPVFWQGETKYFVDRVGIVQ